MIRLIVQYMDGNLRCHHGFEVDTTDDAVETAKEIIRDGLTQQIPGGSNHIPPSDVVWVTFILQPEDRPEEEEVKC